LIDGQITHAPADQCDWPSPHYANLVSVLVTAVVPASSNPCIPILGEWSQLPDLGCFAGLGLQSVIAPNEEVAIKFALHLRGKIYCVLV
jgi:hypothetical protein